jgi:hypothetical protein
MKAGATRLPKTGDVLVMVGTVKGAFILHAAAARGQFQISAPHFPGQQVYSMAYVGAGSRVLAGNRSEHWGAVVS